MKVSILIISKNRKAELEFTLKRLKELIDSKVHEVLVLLDGCEDNSSILIDEFPRVKWTILDKSIGASPARAILYKIAKGDIFIGFDDDAHPLQNNFIDILISEFEKDNKIGLIAFQEIKGIFKNDKEALMSKPNKVIHFLCNDFIGCGFAIKKDSYFATKGFPIWIDIYGEESCVAIEVLSNNENILYTNKVSVNHRVDIKARKKVGGNYFRFQKQLKNTINFYIVYYKKPTKSILKLLVHNFKKYAVKDFHFFKNYFKAIFEVIIMFPEIWRHRKPVSESIVQRRKELPAPEFH